MVPEPEDEVEEGAQDGQHERDTLSVRSDVSVRVLATVHAAAVRAFGHIGGDF